MSALRNENVCGFDVAVNDSLRMSRIQCVSDLDGQAEQDIVVDRSTGNAVLQRHAVQKLHDDEGLAVLLANLINSADIGMVQGGGSLRFPLKPGEGLCVGRNVMRQKFEGDKTVQGDVLGLVDDSHATTAKLFDDVVVRNCLAEHGRILRGENGISQ